MFFSVFSAILLNGGVDMLERIDFNNFRGFKHLELPKLSQITLLTGKNGAGKSSVLEGIFLLMGYSSPETFDKIRSLRGLPNASEITKLWEPVFYNFDTSKLIEITAKQNGKELKLNYRRDDSFSTLDTNQSIKNTFITFSSPSSAYYTLQYTFSEDNATQEGHLFLNPAVTPNGALAMATHVDNINDKRRITIPNTLYVKSAAANGIDDAEVAGWFGELELNGDHQTVVEALKILDPNILDIKTIVQQRYVQLYLRTSDSTVPLKLSGDGMCKLLYLILAIIHNPGSIVLIDEIENGLHYSLQDPFWKIIADAARRSNTQVIATTHSYECIDHAVGGIGKAGMLDEFSLYRIEKVGGKSISTHYPGQLLKDAVNSSMEVR